MSVPVMQLGLARVHAIRWAVAVLPKTPNQIAPSKDTPRAAVALPNASPSSPETRERTQSNQRHTQRNQAFIRISPLDQGSRTTHNQKCAKSQKVEKCCAQGLTATTVRWRGVLLRCTGALNPDRSMASCMSKVTYSTSL